MEFVVPWGRRLIICPDMCLVVAMWSLVTYALGLVPENIYKRRWKVGVTGLILCAVSTFGIGLGLCFVVAV